MKGEVEPADVFVKRVAGGSYEHISARVTERDAAVRAAAIRECADLFTSGLPGSFVRKCRDRILALLDQPKEAG